MDAETRRERQQTARVLRKIGRRLKSDGYDLEAARLGEAASLIEADYALADNALTEREKATLEWLIGELDSEDCLTPGAIYSEHVSPTQVTLTVNLPDRLALSHDVCERESKVIEGYVQRAIRTMLIQSGHYGLPGPTSLIPEHPSDEKAMRLIREAASLMDTKGQAA